MDLEKRVALLEQEVQLLKNQIQATLLDIQEQILTNAYPSLRAEDAPAPPPPPAAPINTVSLQPGASAAPAAAEPDYGDQVSVRKISLNDLNGQSQKPNNHARAQQAAPTLPAAPEEPTWASLDEMEHWVSEKVAKMGARRTRELIRLYTERGRYDEDTAEALLQFVDLYDEDRWSSAPSKSPKASAPPRAATRSAAASPTRQAPAAPAKSKPKAKAQPRPQPKPAPAAPPARPVPHAEMANEDLEESQPRNTVLRLIAGLYNAGAGITPEKTKARK